MTAKPVLRLLGMGLATVLGARKRGFFIPYRYADALPDPESRPPYATLIPVFQAAEPAIRDVLAATGAFAEPLREIGGAPPPAPRWRQVWFPGLDAAAAYTIMRVRAPQRVVEVGSGHSTRFLARAVADGGLVTSITAIDPAPRAALDGLPVTLVDKPVHEAGADAFVRLAAGDVLFIDSSHILMPGSDADFLINRILPALPVGVMVHFHDIFLPDDYPPDWAWRGYNEQLGVAALLQGGAWEILFSSRYVRTRLADAVPADIAETIAPPEGAPESSLWMVKTG